MIIFFAIILFPATSSANSTNAHWIVPSLNETPATFDSGHFIDGTATVPKWAWHIKTNLKWIYQTGFAHRSSQTIFDLIFGLGLPANLELNLALPLGHTVGIKKTIDATAGVRPLDHMGDKGFGLGDFRVTLLWSVLNPDNAVFGLLFGLKNYLPTGNNDKLLGEGGFSIEPFALIAIQMLSTRISFGIGYLLRPEHKIVTENSLHEQDDDLIWKFALRVPKKKDVAYSIEAQGAIGVATHQGVWPEKNNRPIWVGGGIDFPLSRLHRMGMVAGVGFMGQSVPLFSIGMRITWLPVLQDEDNDSVRRRKDKCPLLKEDIDGFQDGDGCPDNDNDRDGFPDDEDKCPFDQGDDFSDDGC